ncbi:M28 family peptidase [Parasphingopyxis algicola]|nr:M28 family metallopeptidase [Parasphingopyxis algicola]QLC26818.1 M28 family peptidase [Parasphingopyxis algicola]
MAEAPQSAAAEPAAAPAAPQISLETVRSLTETMSSDAFEGRAPGTPGEEMTVSLLAERFAAAGLQPGNNGSWYQEVPLVEINADPETAALSYTAGGETVTLAYGSDMVIGTPRVVPEISVEDAELVFVGYGINAPERGWNDYAGIDMAGRIAVILVNDPDFESPTNEGLFDGRAMTYYGRWTYKYEEAARQGAAGAIIVHDTEPASYGWNVVESSWSGPQLNMDAENNHMDRVPIEGWMTNEASRAMLAAAGQDLDALTAAARQPGFTAVPLGITASASVENTIRRENSRNVIAILPGSTRPDEYVIHTAHWDHLGRCTPAPDGDDICNGALDNATGTAGLVALAEAHAAVGPAERSLVFLAVTAEESGLLGSTYYAANPVFPLARTAGGINMDGLNIIGASRDVVVVGYGKSELENYLARAAAAQGRVVRPEPTPEAGYFFRSDHFALARPGVPMIYAEGGEDLVEGGPEAGAAAARDYRANRYHGPKDEYDPNWNWDGAIMDLELYYAIGRELADSTDWPNWNPDAEFRAARDASRPASD